MSGDNQIPGRLRMHSMTGRWYVREEPFQLSCRSLTLHGEQHVGKCVVIQVAGLCNLMHSSLSDPLSSSSFTPYHEVGEKEG